MPVYKQIEHAEQYAVIDARLFDLGLSPEAGWLYAYARSKPPGWIMRADDIERRCGMGRDARKKYQRELVDKGLIELVEVRNEKGQVSRVDWRVHGYERAAEMTGDGFSVGGKPGDIGSRDQESRKQRNQPKGASAPEADFWEPGTEPSEAPETEPTNGKRYAFEGEILKLNQSDYDRWARQYDALDLARELPKEDMSLRRKVAGGEKITPSRAFHITSSRLRIRHMERIMEGRG